MTGTADVAQDSANHPRDAFSWGHSALRAEFAVAADGTLRLVGLDRPGEAGLADPESALPSSS